LGPFWNLVVLEGKILYLTKQLDKNWIKVNSNKSFLRISNLFLVKKRLIELVLGISFNTFLPNLNLLLIILFEIVAKRMVKLLDILVLFTILNRLR